MRIGLISDIHVDINRIDGREIISDLLAAESGDDDLTPCCVLFFLFHCHIPC